jgi:hypothetical protein
MDQKYKTPDIVAIVARGGLGMIPVLGPLAAEIVGGIIPNQRLDRLEDTVARLEAMLEPDEKRLFESKMNDPEFIDLFEEAMLQSTRALTEERRENIAKLLKRGMTDEERGHQSKRRLFEVFASVNDTEAIILTAQAYDPNGESGFWDRHESILNPPTRTIGSSLAPWDSEAAMMSSVYVQHLTSLGLVSGQEPGVVGTIGDTAPSGVRLTPFGWQLVKYLVDAPEVDFSE